MSTTTPAPETCPHVSPAMIAAGFLVCGACENDGPPPPAGFIVDDTARQEARLRDAYTDLAGSLDDLARTATREAKAARRKRPAPDLDTLRAAIRLVQLAEQDVDTATLDLHTARGGHG